MGLCICVLLDAGFRSRVRYINVLDPTNMCYYVSEILDAGRDGPLFMVCTCPQLLLYILAGLDLILHHIYSEKAPNILFACSLLIFILLSFQKSIEHQKALRCYRVFSLLRFHKM